MSDPIERISVTQRLREVIDDPECQRLLSSIEIVESPLERPASHPHGPRLNLCALGLPARSRFDDAPPRTPKGPPLETMQPVEKPVGQWNLVP